MKYQFLFLLFFIMISCNERVSCSNCKSYENCINDKCVLVEGVCYNDSECQNSQICNASNNQCVDNPCESWEIYDGGVCVLKDGACNEDEDCNNNEICINHFCNTNPPTCDGIECSGHGNCQISHNIPICICDNGYQDNDNNLTCEVNCDMVNNCGLNAVSCDDSNGFAICQCKIDYYPNDNYECINPCENVVCENGICISDGVSAYHCECNNGYHEYENSCIANPVKVRTGNYFTCVLLADKKIMCFGDNSLGQLGDGTKIQSFTPVYVLGIDNAVNIVTGNEHACVLLENQKVKCWGNNRFGQLGDGTFENKDYPVEVKDLSGVISLKAGAFHNCALILDGTVKCWGMNLYAQLGNRTLQNSNKAVYVVKDFTLEHINDVKFLTAGKLHNCLQKNDGDIYCWGYNGYGQLGIDKDWRDYPSCNTENCRDAKEIQPVNISEDAEKKGRFVLSNVDEIKANGNFTAAVKGSDIYLWGDNESFQLGEDVDENRLTPPQIPQLRDYSDISLGGSQLCGIKNNELYCLGRNMYGEFGDVNLILKTNTMTKISGLNDISQYSLGVSHNCAIVSNRLKCWGSNARGELGVNNEITAFSSIPVYSEGF